MGDRPHFDVEGCILTINHGHPALPSDPEPHFPVVAFSIHDLEEGVQKLTQHGVEMPWGVENNDSGRWVMFRDPAGNLVELVEFKQEERST
jgi:predicted enzyme related to lactoylglutathione lyase